MNDTVILDQDALQFQPMFGNRLVIPSGPAQIRGNGHCTINGRKSCVSGDEKMVQVNAVYTTSTHTVPGNGVITISSLDSAQLARAVGSPAALIVKGQQFTAQFRPLKPAQMPPPANTPDVSTPSNGRGVFVPSQFFVQAG